jgi:endonuclease/exonuclease/phosphatase family metal-dependent hydrolase
MRPWGVAAVVATASVAVLLVATIPAVESAGGADRSSLGPVGMESVVAPVTQDPDTPDGPESVSVAAGGPDSVSVVQAATVGGPSLIFASWNVCKVSCPPPAPPWDVRRDRVARVIAETGADVIGLQEATNNPTAFAKTQAEDIANLVAPLGYATPSVPLEANQCRRPRNSDGQLAGPSPCDNTAMLLFRPSTTRLVNPPSGGNAGIVMTGSIAGGMDPASASRSVAWAYLEGLNGTGPFLAISLHTDNAKTAEGEASRIALANALGPWAESWNAAHGLPGVPVVLLADLNSYDKRQPQGAQAVLRGAGWTDAYTAPAKRNVQFSTINYNPLLPLSEQGFPTKPYEFRTSKKNPVLNATRIDYVMATGGLEPLDYEVVIRLTSTGAFAPDYQASDHQMVRATLAFPPR